MNQNELTLETVVEDAREEERWWRDRAARQRANRWALRVFDVLLIGTLLGLLIAGEVLR